MAIKYYHVHQDWTSTPQLNWSTLQEKGFRYDSKLGFGRVVWVKDWSGATFVLLAIRTGFLGFGLPPLPDKLKKLKWLLIAALAALAVFLLSKFSKAFR